MNIFKKTIITLATSALLIGCGSKTTFDAKTYAQGFLDAIYKNDSTTLNKIMDVSDEEVEEVHATIIDNYVYSFSNDLDTIALKDELTEMMSELLTHTKYEATDARKDGDSYYVNIKYMPLNVYDGFDAALDTVFDEYLTAHPEVADMAEDDPALDGHISNMIFQTMQQTQDKYSYGDEENFELKLNKEGIDYVIDTDSLYDFDLLLVNWDNYDNAE